MKRKMIGLLISILLLFTFVFSGCGEQKLQGELVGKWYYIHDTEKVGLNIKGDGTATLDGNHYECDFDEEQIYLTDKNGLVQGYKYLAIDESHIYLYKTASYRFRDGEPENGLVGVWVDVDNGNSSFEFTTEGTFREDSYMPGHFFVNEEDGTIKLMYNDHYEDTIIFYTQKDDLLIVEYPWPMLKKAE